MNQAVLGPFLAIFAVDLVPAVAQQVTYVLVGDVRDSTRGKPVEDALVHRENTPYGAPTSLVG